jgi:hypothetical protein
VAWASQYPAHGALHRISAGSFPKFLAFVTASNVCLSRRSSHCCRNAVTSGFGTTRKWRSGQLMSADRGEADLIRTC